MQTQLTKDFPPLAPAKDDVQDLLARLAKALEDMGYEEREEEVAEDADWVHGKKVALQMPDFASEVYPTTGVGNEKKGFDENEKHDPANGQFASGGGGGSESEEKKERSASEWATEMSNMRDTKPRPIDKLYGKNGPTPEQATQHAESMKKWNSEFRKASISQKAALERDNAAFRAKQNAHDSALAFDRASVRNVDADGRLHVAITNISKSNICPYVGNEIPDYDKLGLDSGKLYQLLRDPEELKKAAQTFNNLPVLSKHVPVSALDHRPDLVIGSTGTDAEFDGMYLRNSMVFWAKEAIDAIESEEQKELSSAYRYKADMTPGTYMGAHYDGVMRDIVGNHVALVKEGRAGTDVVVGDSRETITRMENTDMAKLGRKATLVQGALVAFLRPKLAQDAKVDLPSILKDVTAKNYVEKKPAIFAAFKDVKLAKDAQLDDMHKFLDSLDKEGPAEDEFPLPEKKKVGEDEETPEEKEKREAAEKEAAKMEAAKDAEPIKAFLKDKISEDDMKALDALMNGGEVPAIKPDTPAKDADPKEEKVDKKAMDAALKNAIKVATDAATQTQKDIRDAEKKVRPYVGEIAIAQDSAEGVYRTALGMLGVKGIDKVHASALPFLLDAQPVPGSKKETASPLAMDASTIDSFNKMFPGAARIGNLG